ncbi:hypothetical protein GV67_00160 [Pseudorhizobium pelagicum]|uniref:Carnitine dehydratase n=1 Tax=Pseudorhizobium pelagicum TaxID=1509405 RepID=A0A922NYQ4_9HYPH|nr:hypothetical protein GV68_03115 [Pseudorhizobium pelagicum]KEQ09132.1 hypothetical protein GV67_00160 [Pseudorhizobium pelagicum]
MSHLGFVERPLKSLLEAADWHDAPLERLTIEHFSPVLATAWPIAPMASAAIAAVGLAASRLHELRCGERHHIHLDTRCAELAMASSTYLLVDGQAAKFRDPFTGFYRAAEGGWVYLHGNFPHLRNGLLAMLKVDNSPGDIRAAVARRAAGDLEAEAISLGLCAARVRNRAEWTGELQAQRETSCPPLQINCLGSTPRRDFPPAGERPLSELRMLDLSRVIAGPMAGRTMAEHGATVLRVASPKLPFIESLVIDTGFGKHSTFLDLGEETGRRTLLGLVESCDVFLDAYRPSALAARGLGAADLSLVRPDLVSVSLSAFSRGGPWAGRRGYDSLVQSTMGMASSSPDDTPGLLPCQPLDYITGYLAAFAALVGLIRRHQEGGRWHASLSLSATAAWMWRMRDELGDNLDPPAANPQTADVLAFSDVYETDFGSVTALRPPLRMNRVGTEWSRVPVPLGRDPARWPHG